MKVENTVKGSRWSISGLARAFEMDRRTVSERITEANLQPCGSEKGHPVFELKKAAAVLISGYTYTPLSDDFDPAKLPPKDRRDFYDSEKKRLEVEQAQGLLVPVHEFQREISAVCKAVAQFMETLPDILERDCGLDPETIDRVQEATDLQRTELADRLEELEV